MGITRYHRSVTKRLLKNYSDKLVWDVLNTALKMSLSE